jgi:hypothetical protein
MEAWREGHGVAALDRKGAATIGDPTLDFRKLRRSHSTFYAVLNVHPAWRR